MAKKKNWNKIQFEKRKAARAKEKFGDGSGPCPTGVRGVSNPAIGKWHAARQRRKKG